MYVTYVIRRLKFIFNMLTLRALQYYYHMNLHSSDQTVKMRMTLSDSKTFNDNRAIADIFVKLTINCHFKFLDENYYIG